MNQIAREARLPLYHQLYEILHEKILLRQWKPSDRLPTESELVRTYGVSRITRCTTNCREGPGKTDKDIQRVET